MDYYLSALSYCEKYHMQDVGIIVNMNIGTLYNRLRGTTVRRSRIL